MLYVLGSSWQCSLSKEPSPPSNNIDLQLGALPCIFKRVTETKGCGDFCNCLFLGGRKSVSVGNLNVQLLMFVPTLQYLTI